jgi:hypothetical protein
MPEVPEVPETFEVSEMPEIALAELVRVCWWSSDNNFASLAQLIDGYNLATIFIGYQGI